MRHRAIAAIFSLTALSHGCACDDSFTGPVRGCVNFERRDELADPFAPRTVVGRLVDDVAVERDVATCVTLAHSFTVDRGGELGRVQVSWEREGIDLSVALVDGEITVEQIQFSPWASGSSFVVRDAEGLALAVNGANSIEVVDNATFRYGAWRGLWAGGCGTRSLTGLQLTVDGASSDYSVHTPAGVTVGGAELTLFPFLAYTLGPVWFCTDSSSTLNWALVRPPS
jgi:hypothetical protein